jgi:hypothetical protein
VRQLIKKSFDCWIGDLLLINCNVANHRVMYNIMKLDEGKLQLRQKRITSSFILTSQKLEQIVDCFRIIIDFLLDLTIDIWNVIKSRYRDLITLVIRFMIYLIVNNQKALVMYSKRPQNRG